MENSINLNDFELINMVASGSFSKVYKVKEKKTGKYFSAKISHKKLDEELIKVNTFVHEANIISKISHPSILKYIGFNKTNFQGELNPVIITEYMPNGALNDIIKIDNEPQTDFYLSNTSKLIIIYGIVSAMSYLHSNKIIHRDLKPSNILIDDFLCPKISDFGLSKYINKKDDYFESKLIGTPLYLSPESWKNHEYTEAGDVYAFSMILFEIMTSERPFKNCDPLEIAAKVTSGHRPSFINPIPPSYQRLITRCWSQNPSERPTFDQILIELCENHEFVEGIADKSDYKDYIRYIDECLLFPDRTIEIDDFINRYSQNLRRFLVPKKNKRPPSENLSIGIQINQRNDSLNDQKNSDDINDIFTNGLRYMSGREVPFNIVEALKLFKMAAEKGHLDSMNKYAWMLENGYGVTPNKEAACFYYKKAADLGHIDAMYHIGWMLLSGEGVHKNEEEAALYFKKAADLGHYNSMYNYALMLQSGIGVKVDNESSFHYYKLAAENGQIDAMNNIGLLFENGVGVTENKEEAVRYYKMASEKGHVKSMYNLASMLYNGKGCTKSKKEAAVYFRLAAKKGHVESMFILASMLSKSEGIERNINDAIFYFKMAADKGHLKSMHNYALILKNGLGGYVDIKKALKYFKMAADRGNVESMYEYASTIENGEGLQRNIKEAEIYYKMAADKGHIKSIEKCKNLNNSDICSIC